MEKPTIFDSTLHQLKEIKSKCQPYKTMDTYKEQLEELFLIRNPRFKFNNDYQQDFRQFLEEHSQNKDLQSCGNWVYFPWNSLLVHYLKDDLHQEVRTARNKNLISEDEQERFYNSRVGIAGLSVGSHGAITIALMGGSKHMKLADPDTVSPSNLNRIRFTFAEVGVNKAELVAQYIYQLNPYAEIDVYSQGVDKNNPGEFLDGLDILIEELDDIEIKVSIREEAKKRSIPVVMATDNGDDVILDIERFDLNPDAPIFYGKLEGLDISEIKKSPRKMYEAMAKIIDVSLVPPKVLHSVMEVGKTIYSWPQLASAATLSGAVIAYIVRKIVLGEKINEGKLRVNLDLIFDSDYKKNEGLRKEELGRFFKALGDL
ncbi:hypothetical protein A3D66_01230 [Candidatus Kaiserbacteria bacterium RIFCSPHIGHO2_02_FULL_50_9]|uniref:THIF-type NAD/FAD binding fold domain-containing protein n=1 Tax=Candidatus Kaiserbacteria bacterium RIFCSPLOWO2_01_FULL_51_21 TaxID=1798508 RepID=A0A1F6EDP2_9BACT|nr:MAG: hypothetical protein A2761_01530 [Candidatus Kaiserbacteria bacterium RIFCSPHIGHO2_01_FULL_51_33]OGG63518.1 MAG: hypothetical protein A3D66_01230 [Candidatus Kaiserbacteria bacterium RIFCSPHIGHO2_02_FULL_50_9]OGG71788.1 MAG: hypothetical protein A3A35_02610 [Candidatus Kaiserbacteria bacterium RIFCSPLOWO2_01_FULL_51_21]